MSSVTANGNAYSDDGTQARDMQGGGYRNWLLPMLSDVMVDVNSAIAAEAAAAASAATATSAAAGWLSTASDSRTVGAGTLNLTVETGKQFAAGTYVLVMRTSDKTGTWMHGSVTSYTSGTGAIVVEVSATSGSGTFSDWTIALSGVRGAAGSPSPDITRSAKTGAYTVLSTDKGALIDCTSGTYTLAFQSAATLADGWWCYVRNSGTGTITLDPNGAETIDGAASVTLLQNDLRLIQCDGTALRTVFSGRSSRRLPIFSADTVNKVPASLGEGVLDAIASTQLTSVARALLFDSASALFVACSAASESNISTSPDGETWTLRAMPSAGAWAVCKTTAGWVATVNGSTATATATSPSGTWSSATALPAVTKTNAYIPCAVGARAFVLSNTASTAYYTDNAGASWTTATLPVAAASSVNPWALNSLFAYASSTTTYYTSATGETGSWTARSFPGTLGSYNSIRIGADGNLWCVLPGGNYYWTSNGIDWNDSGIAEDSFYNVGFIEGVFLHLMTTDYGDTWTHNGHSKVTRFSQYQLSVASVTPVIATDGTIYVLALNSTGLVGLIAPATTTNTAVFEGV